MGGTHGHGVSFLLTLGVLRSNTPVAPTVSKKKAAKCTGYAMEDVCAPRNILFLFLSCEREKESKREDALPRQRGFRRLRAAPRATRP